MYLTSEKKQELFTKHGFAKKKNADHQLLSTVLFLREHLLK